MGYQENLIDTYLMNNAINETYVSVTLTNYTLGMRNSIKTNLSNNTQTQKNINLVISLIFISLATIIYSYEIFRGINQVTQRFNMAKKIIFLVPLQTAMIEETFIKILKAQSTRLEIVKWLINQSCIDNNLKRTSILIKALQTIISNAESKFC